MRVLRHGVVAGQLADVDDLGAQHDALGGEPVEHPAGAEPVGDDDVGRLERAEAADREQAGVAGSGADERDAGRRRRRSAVIGCLPAAGRGGAASVARAGRRTTSSMRMPMARITRIVASTPARSASSRLWWSIEPRPKPIVPPGRDDLGGHERAPRERPALLEAGDVAGQRGGEHDEGGEPRASGAEHGAHAPELRRHLLDARDEAVHDRRHRAHEHDEVHRGVGEPEPEDRGGHPRHRRQHLQARDDRADRAAQRLHLGEQQAERRADDDGDEEPDARRVRGS